MAYRTMKPDLWQTPWFEVLAPQAKLLFLYLCTTPAGNAIGLFQVSAQRMANDTGLSMSELPDALGSLTATDRVRVYDGGWVWIVKAAKHQIHGLSKGMRAHIASSIASCTCEKARQDFIRIYKKLAKPWPRHCQAITKASSVSSQGSVVSSQTSSSPPVSLPEHTEEKQVSPLPSPRDTNTDEQARLTAQGLVEGWNEVCAGAGLPAVKALTKQRATRIALRLREHPTLGYWEEVLNRLAETRFLTGHNDRGWRATLDWLIANDTNAVKVLEGRYDETR